MSTCGLVSVPPKPCPRYIQVTGHASRIRCYRNVMRSAHGCICSVTCVASLGKDGLPERKHPVRSLPGVLVVVEGVNDMRRIRSFLDVDVYVLGSATKSSGLDTIETLKEMSKKYARLVLLLDPDVAGRQARNEIDRNIEGCWHAFIPTALARSNVKKKYKDIGDIGVEHASHKAIMTAIARSRKSNHGVKRFSRDNLISLGLIAPMHERGNNITLRRQLVCEYLGLGQCDGKQVLRQLNAYGFLERDLMEGLEYAEKYIENL